ncbi:MAG TPA: HAD hydrolase family protein [Pyrinomonadaceae bacterium]|nr:HAD hydrolase family protein [Pyrinomonadaceae bacterium]
MIQTANIRLLLMDCDGVLTDGRLYFSNEGEVIKVFHVRDGQGIVSWHAAGFQSGIISGRAAGSIIHSRADELGMKYVRTCSSDKVTDFREIIIQAGVTADETAFIGDDIGDLELMRLVGFSVAVADATEEVRTAAAHVTEAKGGQGAVREVIDLLLRRRTD